MFADSATTDSDFYTCIYTLHFHIVMIFFVELILYTKCKMIKDHIIIENYCDTTRGNSDIFEDIPLLACRKSSVCEEQNVCCCFNLYDLIYNLMFPQNNLITT